MPAPAAPSTGLHTAAAAATYGERALWWRCRRACAVDIQDVLVVRPAATSFADAIEHAARCARQGAAAETAADAATQPPLVADEGGLAARARGQRGGARGSRTRASSAGGTPACARARRYRCHAARRRRRLPARARGAKSPGWRRASCARSPAGAAPPTRSSRSRSHSARDDWEGVTARRPTCSARTSTAARRRPLRASSSASRASISPGNRERAATNQAESRRTRSDATRIARAGSSARARDGRLGAAPATPRTRGSRTSRSAGASASGRIDAALGAHREVGTALLRIRPGTEAELAPMERRQSRRSSTV